MGITFDNESYNATVHEPTFCVPRLSIVDRPTQRAISSCPHKKFALTANRVTLSSGVYDLQHNL